MSFTKSDLKDGMRVWTRAGETYLYDATENFLLRNTERALMRLSMTEFREDLTDVDGASKWDIVKVEYAGEVVYVRDDHSDELEKLRKQATEINRRIKELENA